LLALPLQAQLPETPPKRCRSLFSYSDDFRELIGERVHPKIVIDEVKFEGANHLPDANLEELIASLKDFDFKDNSGWLEEAELLVSKFWGNRGFFKVNVKAEEQILNPDRDPQHVQLTFHIEEGIRYWLKDIRFQSSDPEVPLALSPDQLRNLIPMQDGDTLSVKAIRDGMDALKDVYNARGYMDFV
jgi:outer membrane protein assembly factor BamA